MSALSDEIRRIFGEGDTVRDAGLVTPESIRRFDDILYGPDKVWHRLDLYRPKSTQDDVLPVIVNVHGGGWVYGDKERYQFYCMNLAERGFAVVNFTYRLAPEFKFPAPLEDLNLVCEWMIQNAENYHMDLNRLFAVGDSAGAHLLGLYTCICTNAEYAGRFAFSVPDNIVFRAVAFNCGAYQIDLNNSEDLMSRLTDDFLKMQAPLLAEKLSERNIPFLYRLYGDQKSRLKHVFHLDIRSAAAKMCNSDECDFFMSFLI